MVEPENSSEVLNPQAPENTSARQPFLSNANGYYYYYGGYNDVSEKLMPTDKKVYLVDFKERSATPIFFRCRMTARDRRLFGVSVPEYNSKTLSPYDPQVHYSDRPWR